jgi:cytoskeletal protein RodZ
LYYKQANMQDYLTKLRAKPDHKKRQIAFGVSSAFVVIVGIIWIATFKVRFPGLVLKADGHNTANTTAQTASVLQAAAASSPLEQIRQQLNGESVPGIQATQPANQSNTTGPENDGIISNDVIITNSYNDQQNTTQDYTNQPVSGTYSDTNSQNLGN